MLRELRDDDIEPIVGILRDASPWWVVSEQGLRHRLASVPPREQRRDWVAEDGGDVVGWSKSGREIDTVRGDVAWLNVLVRPQSRGRGVGTALYAAAAEHAAGLGARRILTRSDDDEVSRGFAARRAFAHTLTQSMSRLDVASVDPRELEELRPRKRAEGFELAPFAAFDDRPELVYAVDAEAMRDEPSDEPVEGVPFDEWLATFWKDPDIAREGSFVVVHDGGPVALTQLILDAGGRRAGNGFTGTLRDFRGRGLARLAKLATIAWAADHGVTSVTTGNDKTNAAMLAVNTRLGYQPFATTLSWAKDIE